MKLGLIVRAEDRGLGIQTHEMFQHLNPARTLVITNVQSEFPEHLDRYPGADHLHSAAVVEGNMRAWMEGLDVVATVETPYDWQMPAWAKAENVATVVHGNPEFYRHDVDPQRVHPTAWWWPTVWRLDRLPPGPVIPVPVGDGARKVGAAAPDTPDPLVVLHVAGRKAFGDRNGTEAFMAALPLITHPVHVRVFAQDRNAVPPRSTSRRVQVEYVAHTVDDRWSMYQGAHVLMMPRKYGGLCLPVIEALGAGVAVSMPFVSPNWRWPIIPVHNLKTGQLTVPAGRIDTAIATPVEIARVINELAADREKVANGQRAARDWSDANTWERLLPRYLDALADAADTR